MGRVTRGALPVGTCEVVRVIIPARGDGTTGALGPTRAAGAAHVVGPLVVRVVAALILREMRARPRNKALGAAPTRRRETPKGSVRPSPPPPHGVPRHTSTLQDKPKIRHERPRPPILGHASDASLRVTGLGPAAIVGLNASGGPP